MASVPAICFAPMGSACGLPAGRHSPTSSRVLSPLRMTLPGSTTTSRSLRSVGVRANDRDEIGKKVNQVMETANNAVDGVTDLIPESVPRSTAKLGVIGVGFLLTFWVFQKVLSTVITLAVLGAAGYFFYNSSGMGSGSGEDIDVDGSDPLKDAKKIMDKYK
mmetsp:Transcript_4621/g.12868  ORF Transcript_4621/g.12868 Transcript_4621/m.12868 type:complete len:162 (-) Transcript_4621:221-706(-)|eukprot:CAMPEP_0117675256 /NCGR_PEP_ID=MMETSP0804-20121206/15503_1 /TAXON_ID=1074897 /ORGANISM="Tetraselmis astigmatica, Strain CCMP880" /LENGTH=161 /DNA_ID=CAMNT_0005484237 /DNA_START=303 /DNA_END=788 /DNA_ORIENTATION=+